MYSSRLVRVISALVVALVLPELVSGQTGSSAISGFVKDGTGAALPGATVKVINAETGVAVELTTNEEGVYRATALVPGQRSVLRGPSVITTDLTLEKAIVLSDRHSIDVRVEAYNLLNRANFNPPGSVLGAADFGVISSARSARTVQLGARFSF